MTTQIVGLQFATQSQWRYVLYLSATLGAIQIALTTVVTESPVWLTLKGHVGETNKVTHRIWGLKVPTSAVEPLLQEEGLEPDRRSPENREESVKIPQLLRSREFRKPLAIVCLAMLTQQISGKVIRSCLL